MYVLALSDKLQFIFVIVWGLAPPNQDYYFTNFLPLALM